MQKEKGRKRDKWEGENSRIEEKINVKKQKKKSKNYITKIQIQNTDRKL